MAESELGSKCWVESAFVQPQIWRILKPSKSGFGFSARRQFQSGASAFCTFRLAPSSTFDLTSFWSMLSPAKSIVMR